MTKKNRLKAARKKQSFTINKKNKYKDHIFNFTMDPGDNNFFDFLFWDENGEIRKAKIETKKLLLIEAISLVKVSKLIKKNSEKWQK